MKALGLTYPAIDPNVISVGAVWADDFGSRNFSSGAKEYSTDADRIASFSQRHPLLDIFAPGVLITGANANGGTTTRGGTSQATPYVTGIATLAQQIAQEYLGRELSLSEFNHLLDSTSDIIIDGDDEDDNVNNTGENYARINVLALAEGILNLDGDDTVTPPTETGDDHENTPLNHAMSLSHTVTVEAGDIIDDLNFGIKEASTLDIDGNSILELQDYNLIDLYAGGLDVFEFDFLLNNFSNDLIGENATRTDANSILSYLNEVGDSLFDIDENAIVELQDYNLIDLYAGGLDEAEFGFLLENFGNDLIGNNANRSDAASILAHFETIVPQ